MDTFKLLTRSTNLQKSNSSSQHSTVRHVPSAADYPSLIAPDQTSEDFNSLKPAPRGIKRKGLYGDKSRSFNTASHLDFLSRQREIASGTSQNPSYGPQVPESTSDREAKLDGNGDGYSRTFALSHDECKRVLRHHKLKVTLLHGHGEEEGERVKHYESSPRRWSNHVENKRKARKHLVPQILASFKQLVTRYGVSKRLAENADAQGYICPTNVQFGSIPMLLGNDEDRGILPVEKIIAAETTSDLDLLTVAPTGSGKTLAFMIGLLHGLLKHRQKSMATNSKTQAIILAPTHELVDQIVNEGKKLAFGTGVRVMGLKKGMKIASDQPKAGESSEEAPDGQPPDGLLDGHTQKHSRVKAGILVSTPLMLVHTIASPDFTSITLPDVRYLVLDEADVLLDPLFRDQTLRIWNACSSPHLQASLWSATINSSTEILMQSFILQRREELGLNTKASNHLIIRLVVGLKDSAVSNISHRLVYAATEQGKLMALRQLLNPGATSTASDISLQPPFLVFTQTIPRAVALYSELLYDIPPEAGGSSRIAVLHSDLSENVRSAIMAGFRNGEIWILITTDLLSRGVDFRGINGVVNYDIPNSSGIYVHRVGRTGRQGREGGVAVTLYTKEDIPYVKNVANVIAASEKQLEKIDGTGEGRGVQKWLLDALPTVSKNTRKELKRRGVAGRRTPRDGDSRSNDARRMRISTKSGYDRRLENKRKGARKPTVALHKSEGLELDDEEWGGLQD